MIEEARAKHIVGTPEIADALRKYKFVTGQLFKTDVSDDYTFQEDYCRIYLPENTYSEKFLIEFFRYLEAMKKESNISFREAFEELKAIEGKNEMIAASVMVHTINPRFAIWDDQLAEDFFDINAPEKDASVERCCRIYEDFIDAFYAYANSPEGMMMVHAFDSRFPNAEIPNLIKVGFIIWGERVGIANDH